jgi:hypothetical protein
LYVVARFHRLALKHRDPRVPQENSFFFKTRKRSSVQLGVSVVRRFDSLVIS